MRHWPRRWLRTIPNRPLRSSRRARTCRSRSSSTSIILGRERHLGIADSTTQSANVLDPHVWRWCSRPMPGRRRRCSRLLSPPWRPGRRRGRVKPRPARTWTSRSRQRKRAQWPCPKTRPRPGLRSNPTVSRRVAIKPALRCQSCRAPAARDGNPGSNLNGSSAQTGEAVRSEDTALDPASSDNSQFAQVLQRASVASDAVADLDGASTSLSAASQIADQLTAPDARDVISAVKSDGDTRVIELQFEA